MDNLHEGILQANPHDTSLLLQPLCFSMKYHTSSRRSFSARPEWFFINKCIAMRKRKLTITVENKVGTSTQLVNVKESTLYRIRRIEVFCNIFFL